MKSITNQASEIKSRYREQWQKRIVFIVICIAIIVMLAGVSATLGSYKIDVVEVYSLIWDKIVHGTEDTATKIVWELRLPRILMAVLAGAGLAVAGTVMQSVLRNPLGDPFTLGISAGASLGAAIAIVLGAGFTGGMYLIIGNAFLFSLVPAFIVFTLTFRRKATPETLILAGVAIMYLFSSATSLIIYFSSTEALNHAFFWMIGSVDGASWDTVVPVAIILAIFSVPLMWKAKDLNIIASGEEVAKSLGIEVERTRIVMLGITSLMASAIVAFTGPIGFIGLVAPHFCRMVVGGDNRVLLPAAAASGALILLLSDTIARTIIAPIILPGGVVTQIVGAPVLIYLILRRGKEFW